MFAPLLVRRDGRAQLGAWWRDRARQNCRDEAEGSTLWAGSRVPPRPPSLSPHRRSSGEAEPAERARAARAPQPARDACLALVRISLRMRSRRGSAVVSTCVIAAATAGCTAAIWRCISWATAR
jgi:hypothetical protein